VAGCIPFSHNNQSPRNTYQCAMSKQAIGLYATNYRSRFDSIAHVLDHPQAPIVTTRISRAMRCRELPSGVNVVVAIACHSGFNQEDSVIFNRASVERGMFSSTFYRTYKEHNCRNHSTGEEECYFCPGAPGSPAPVLKSHCRYGKLARDGFVPVNTHVSGGDVIVGKCMPRKHKGAVGHKDTSVAVRSSEHGFVDLNCHNNNHFTTVNAEGYSFCKVRLRSTRVPVVGDKFSSRHGQKGTVGCVRDEADMPFGALGIVPDVIVNPHAIPSRMTVGQLKETICGKAACETGGAVGTEASPFAADRMGEVFAALQEAGFDRHCDEVMYDGLTCRPLRVCLFVGVAYYQRLKHMTEDKCHSRAGGGPVASLIRQPAEGRSRDGGLRLGEMEVWCQWSHGISHFLKERMMDCSDGFAVHVCRRCRMPAVCNPSLGMMHCRLCDNSTSFAEVRVPYALKLLGQELMTMGIASRMATPRGRDVCLSAGDAPGGAHAQTPQTPL
jgi:DNA-directed RNA polymerase II subunit RPB2